MTRIRVIVLDGVDWLWTNDNPDQMPRLFEHQQDGCSALLRSCKVPVTSDAVAALLAGKEIRVPFVNNCRFSTSQEIIHTRPWFYELKKSDMTVALCNVPLTWPAFRLPEGGWLTSGYPVPPIAVADARRPWKYPSHLETRGYPIRDVIRDCGAGGSDDLKMVMGYENEIVEWFLKAPRADVEFIWLRSTDSAGHHLWGEEGYNESIRHVDALVDQLSIGAENIVVISDHGFDEVDSPRCRAYMASDHGPPTRRAGLKGGHSEEGILFAWGDDIRVRGRLTEQSLLEVAGGIFDILQVAPPPDMISNSPAWASPISAEDEKAIREKMENLGYM